MATKISTTTGLPTTTTIGTGKAVHVAHYVTERDGGLTLYGTLCNAWANRVRVTEYAATCTKCIAQAANETPRAAN